jgi:hypothetical protein
MAGAQSIKAIAGGKSKLRFQIAGFLAAMGLVLAFIIVRFQTKEYLITTAAGHHDEHGYTRLWFDPSDALVGATRQGPLLKISRWSGEHAQFDLGTSDNVAWAMPPDLSRLAWIAGSTLYCRTEPLEQGAKTKAPVAIKLAANQSPLALGFLPDGSADVTTADGSVSRFDCASGALLGSKHLGFPQADQAATEQDYVAITSDRARSMMLYRYQAGQDWTVVEESSAPEPPFRLIIPAPGVMATLTLGGLWSEGKTKNSPGAILSAVSHLENLIVTGDFDKVLVLPREGERYPIADDAPGSLVAATLAQIAVSGSSGTSLFNLGSESRVTATGRSLSWAATLMLLASLLLCIGPLVLTKLLELLATWVQGGKKKGLGKNVPGTLTQPPPELISTFAAGQGIVWAGAGLSAQSGMPTREPFVTATLHAAAMEQWVEPGPLRRLQALVGRGQIEDALNELVTGANRGNLISHYRAVYSKYSALSRSHKALTRIPLAAVITTNYDGLLDCTETLWAANVMTPASPLPEFTDVPFLLKVYGDLLTPTTVLLSQFEFAATLARSAVTQIPRHAWNSRTLLFVGCSLSGLLTDLKVIGPPAKITRKHYAAVGVTSAAWEKQAAELSSTYGIEVLPCTAEGIAEALPVFLESLAQQVEDRQTAAKPAPEVEMAEA